MLDQVNHIESCIAYYDAKIKSDKELIKNYKKSDTYNFQQQRMITFKNELIEVIWNNLDTNQESVLGYFKGDDNSVFKKS